MFGNVDTPKIPLNINERINRPMSCDACRRGESLSFDFTMAFQPIVDLTSQSIVSYEALVRGLNDEPAGSVIEQVTETNLYRFDQTCRVKAIALAAKLGLTKRLNINFLPGAVYRPEVCIQTTLDAAQTYQFPPENITFEIVETEMVKNKAHLENIITYYKTVGFRTALDDFGTGFSNLDALAELSPDVVKLDRALISNVHRSTRKQHILRSTVGLLNTLKIDIVAEGIETEAERDILAEMGVMKQQGFYFAKPQLEAFIDVEKEKFV